jgi:hypothetical protein
MTKRTARVAYALAAFALVLLSAGLALSSESGASTPGPAAQGDHPRAAAAPAPLSPSLLIVSDITRFGDGVVAVSDAYAAEQQMLGVEVYVSTSAAIDFVVASQAEDARNAAARVTPRASAPSVSTPAPVSGGGGSCFDGPIPAYIVQRESGGNPSAMNPSGAYGCFQIMPYVWSANCADLSRDVSGQIACAGRISNGGTNLAPWAL